MRECLRLAQPLFVCIRVYLCAHIFWRWACYQLGATHRAYKRPPVLGWQVLARPPGSSNITKEVKPVLLSGKDLHLHNFYISVICCAVNFIFARVAYQICALRLILCVEAVTGGGAAGARHSPSAVLATVRLWGRCTVVESCGSAKCSCTAPSVRQRRVLVEEEEEHRQQQSCVERAESVGRRLTPRPRRLPLDSTLGREED